MGNTDAVRTREAERVPCLHGVAGDGVKVLLRWLHGWLSGREQWLSPRRPHFRGNAGCQEGRRRVEGFWQVPGRTVQYLHNRIENITYQEPKCTQEWDVSAQNSFFY